MFTILSGTQQMAFDIQAQKWLYSARRLIESRIINRIRRLLLADINGPITHKMRQ